VAAIANTSRYEWYRHKTWTTEDHQAFLARLGRSRSAYHKAQYLKIQALTLLETTKQEYVQGALDLADLGVKEYPDPFSLGSLHQIRAACFVRIHRTDDAYAAFQESFRATRLIPNLHFGVELDFAWWVATRNLSDFYDEALKRLEESKDSQSAFIPAIGYRLFGALALIAKATGDAPNARRWAKQAVAAVNSQESPFPRHRLFGLVRNPDALVLRRLRRMAVT
jgi:tetratricopeptide (TPR) repeat protein